jgi:DNA-binding transcriptional MerR regulator
VSSVTIPNRSVFRAQEVCEIAEVQPYVLRTWEAEFPDLGVSKGANGPRMYRRADVERVLKIKHLLFVDGLTLAGARRRLSAEGLSPPAEPVTNEEVAALMDAQMRDHLRDVRRGLQWILGVLGGQGITPEDRVLSAAPRAAGKAASKKAARPAPKKAARGRRR